jgi:hypothetical protein
LALQVSVGLQVPHWAPQPSSPHVLPAQLGVQEHLPSAPQVWGAVQVPHWPPQPSGPQVLPVHWG